MWCNNGETELNLRILKASGKPIDGGREAFEVQRVGPCPGCKRRSWRGRDMSKEHLAILVTRVIDLGDGTGVAPNVTACITVDEDLV